MLVKSYKSCKSKGTYICSETDLETLQCFLHRFICIHALYNVTVQQGYSFMTHLLGLGRAEVMSDSSL